jgi:hypothetical protein
MKALSCLILPVFGLVDAGTTLSAADVTTPPGMVCRASGAFLMGCELTGAKCNEQPVPAKP